jgi:hypothetical protein
MKTNPISALLLLAALLAPLPASGAPQEQPLDPEGLELFERRIRPLLVDQCYSCHSPSAKSVKGGLLLDTRANLLKGGDTGPALVPGDPDRSLLLKALRSTDPELKMPPKKKLPADVVADVEAWIRRGAPDPRTGAPAAADPVAAKAAAHWAFKAPRAPADGAPSIDGFIRARLQAAGLQPQAPADRRTLLRRACLDLLGLPPTEAEIAAFEADRAPDAFARVVDALLARPEYGERWARHWMDVARYSDTKGYVFQEERRYPYAYTYRDWLVRVFNEDMPYDRFLTCQIAADLMPDRDPRDLAAMGFLTLGRRFLNRIPDIIDDRMDVVFRGALGLTVGCARCHDHKYDPISIKEYYSLYGVFASSIEPKDLPLLQMGEKTKENLEYEKELQARRDEVAKFRETRHREILAKLREPKTVAAYREAAEAAQGKSDEEVRKIAEKRDLFAFVLTRWRDALAKGPVPEDLEAPDAPPRVAFADLDRVYTRADRDRQRQLENKIQALQVTHPGAPQRAMALQDGPVVEPHVFIRGNPGNRGEQVPRRFLSIAAGGRREPFTQGSGRLELARAVVSRENPLVSRVIVNRVWMHHFGQGLVRTPSDLGLRSDPPTHPELLDWLAVRFMDDGWSLKKLHRLILGSATWQQRSDETPAAREKDPSNLLLSRQNRRRLDFEAMRDSMLAVSGQLDPARGGRPVQISENPTASTKMQAETILTSIGDPNQERWSRRRSVYLFIDRQNLPNTFRDFDFASPDAHTPQRFTTTVPQQALFLMNSSFVADLSVALVQKTAEGPAENRVERLYRAVYGRAATPEEVRIGRAWIDAEGRDGAPVAQGPGAWSHGYGVYDEAAKRLKAFTPLPQFAASGWQGGAKLPDSKLGWLLLTAEGGHPGNDQQGAAVRRWTAPKDAVVSVAGVLAHRQAGGDGVRARIVSSRLGELASWTAHNTEADTAMSRIEVKAGDTLDFIVDCRREESFDSFAWAPVIRSVEAASATGAPPGEEWSAAKGFRGPEGKAGRRLGPWERYAQALLLSNEFMFAD